MWGPWLVSFPAQELESCPESHGGFAGELLKGAVEAEGGGGASQALGGPRETPTTPLSPSWFWALGWAPTGSKGKDCPRESPEGCWYLGRTHRRLPGAVGALGSGT